MIVGDAFIRVSPETKGFGPAAEREVKTGLGPVTKAIGAAVAAGFVVRAGTNLFKGLIADAEESRVVTQQTAAAIKSTGGAAHVSAKQVDELATALSNKTGIDDEQIAKAENLLLTFTNVRNEVGKGNDIFGQATDILADMAKALGTDVSGSAIQLGKALNDPVAGITALTRVGVTFTAQQKDQIKQLVASGKTLEAQKIILKELRTEFGGSAEATAKATDKLRVAFGNFREDIGFKLLPIVDKVSLALANALPKALDATFRAISRLGDILAPAVRKIGTAVDAVFGGFQNPDALIGPAIPKFDAAFLRIGAGVATGLNTGQLALSALVQSIKDPDVTSDGFVGVAERIGSGIRKGLDPVIKFVDDHSNLLLALFAPGIFGVKLFINSLTSDSPNLLGTLDTLQKAVQTTTGFLTDQKDVLLPLAAAAVSFAAAFAAYSQVTKTVNTVSTAFTLLGPAVSAALAPLLANPAGLIIAGIVALGVAVTVAYLKVKPFRDAVDNLASFLRTVAVGAFDAVTGAVAVLGDAFGGVADGVSSALSGVAAAAAGPIAGVQDALAPLGRFLRDDLGATFAAAGDFIAAVFERLASVIGPVVRVTTTVLRDLADIVGTVLTASFKVAGPLITSTLKIMADVLETAGKVAIPAFTLAVSLLGTIVETVFNNISAIVKAFLAVVRGVFQVGAGLLRGDFSKIWEGLVTIVKAPFDAIEQIVTGSFRIISGFLQGVPAKIGQLFRAIWGGLVQITQDALGGVVDVVSGQFDAVLVLIGELPGKVGALAGDLAAGFVELFTEGITLGLAKGDELADGLIELLKKLPARIAGLAGTIAAAFADLMTKLAFTVAVGAGRLVESIIAGVLGLPKRLADITGTVTKAVGQLGTDMFNALASALAGLGGKVLNLAGDALGAIADIGKGMLRGVIQAINDLIPNNVGRVEIDTPVGSFTVFPGIDLPDNPIPNPFAAGGLVAPRNGGVVGRIAEAGRPEGVFPLPPGLVDGLTAIGKGALNGSLGGGGPLVGQLLVQGGADPAATADRTVSRLRALMYLELGRT